MLAIDYVKYVCCRGRSGPEVIKLFSCSGHEMTEMLKNEYISCC